jgi:hypothetical protein
MRIIGPSPLYQHRTCVSGQTCVLESILGEHLMAGDQVLVLETCGLPSAIPKHAYEGRVASVFASGAHFTWGSIAITSPGGKYRLCWCASGFGCTSSEQYRTDFGFLQILGPSPIVQDRTCISGQTCNIDSLLGSRSSSPSSSLGQDLSVADKIMVLDT